MRTQEDDLRGCTKRCIDWADPPCVPLSYAQPRSSAERTPPSSLTTWRDLLVRSTPRHDVPHV